MLGWWRAQMRTLTASRGMGFADRAAAGAELASAVRELILPAPLIVLGLPRGGVVVAYEVARQLHAPLDVLVVRKIGSPTQREFAIGAIATGGVLIREPAAALLDSEAREFEKLADAERVELERRERTYRAGLAPLDLRGATAILVDDGLATGSTMLAAVRAARRLGASMVVAAAPVGSDEAAARLAGEADHVAVLRIPPMLHAVGEWYDDFTQVEDEEVRELLKRAHAAHGSPLR